MDEGPGQKSSEYRGLTIYTTGSNACEPNFHSLGGRLSRRLEISLALPLWVSNSSVDACGCQPIMLKITAWLADNGFASSDGNPECDVRVYQTVTSAAS